MNFIDTLQSYSNSEIHENSSQDIFDATELASLVGSYFPKNKYKNFIRERFFEILEIRKLLKGLLDGTKESITRVIEGTEKIYTKEEIDELREYLQEIEYEYNNLKNDILYRGEAYFRIIFEGEDSQITTTDIDDLLGGPGKINVIDRIKELYSNKNVRYLYNKFYSDISYNLNSLEGGRKYLKELKFIELLIGKLNEKILETRVLAFSENRSLTTLEVSYVGRVLKEIDRLSSVMSNLLKKREVASIKRLFELRSYKYQLEQNGFINFPSRERIINDIIEKILLGENVLLVGPTGTGKTVLAVEAVKRISKYLKVKFEQINGNELISELNSNTFGKDNLLDDFVVVLSGHSGMTVSEFIAKPSLKSDGKGGTYTDTQLGKLLKAFVEGKIPIIDEIDLIPNDVLMRIKHLFTLRSGQYYSPQEDGGKQYKIITSNLIATANMKSDKHPDREDVDPAIVRLFGGIQVPYLEKTELYDLALSLMIEYEGFIYGIDVEDIAGKSSHMMDLSIKFTFLCRLIDCVKNIEDSYMGKGEGINANIGGSDRSGLFLHKAVLETGNFINLIRGYKGSGKDFFSFVKTKIIEFISNGAYPKSDRLIMLKIFSLGGIIGNGDINEILSKIHDISKSEIESNLLNGGNDFHHVYGVLDPYKLVNLDPYGIRKFNQLEEKDDRKKIIEKLKKLSEEYTMHELERFNEIGDIAYEIFEKMEEDSDFQPSIDLVKKFFEVLVKHSRKITSFEFKKFGGVWKEVADNIGLESIEWEGDYLDSIDMPTINVEWPEKEQEFRRVVVNKYNEKSSCLLSRKVVIDGGFHDFDINILDEKILKSINEGDIHIEEYAMRTIYIEGVGHNFYVVIFTIVGNNRKYTAIEIPRPLLKIKLSETYIGKKIVSSTGKESDYPVDLGLIGKNWIIEEYSIGHFPMIDFIECGIGNSSSDYLNKISEFGLFPISIRDTIIMAEIVKYGLGDYHLNYMSSDLDNELQDLGPNESLRKSVQEVQNFLKKMFLKLSFEQNGVSGSLPVVNSKVLGLYQGKDGNIYVFVRGQGTENISFGGGKCIDAGIFSLWYGLIPEKLAIDYRYYEVGGF